MVCELLLHTYFNLQIIMITIRRNGRLILLCVICTLACIALLGTSTFADNVALVASRNWQIAQVNDVFADAPLIEDSVVHMPTNPVSQPSDSTFSFEGVQDIEVGGVVLLSHQLHPLHAGRSLRLAHVG